jgi:simple sugar transport system permease protein
VGFVVSGIVLAVLGYNPGLTFASLFSGAFGSLSGISTTFGNTTPLILTALTFAVGLKVGLFNIGAEGQLYMGAVASISVVLLPLPDMIKLPLAIAFSCIAGVLWSLPVFALKAYRNVNEVISTIMMNWVSYFLVLYVTATLLVDPVRQEKTVSAPPFMRFPVLFGSFQLPSALFFSISVAFLFFFYLWFTPSGYELRASGLNQEAARFGGISTNKAMLYAFMLGGVAAGAAGSVQVLGRQTPFAIYTDLSNLLNIGFNGIGVALMGRNHPLGIIVAAIFFGALQTGVTAVQLYANVPYWIVQIIEGIIVVSIAAPEAFRRIRGWFR